MLVHLRLVVPKHLAPPVRDLLIADDRVTNVTDSQDAAIDPPGDLIEADVAREAANDVLDELDTMGLGQCGGILVSDPTASPFVAAQEVERAAAGDPDDGVIWDAVLEKATGSSRSSWNYYLFLIIATALAAVAVITDSPIIVVGAMVVGPDFAVVASICAGVVLGRPQLALRAVRLLVGSYLISVVVVMLLALVARAFGVITAEMLLRPRPLTDFIWRPDMWSVVVALLAGTAGALAMTAAKSNALVGVFISVTTVPATGNLALALALGAGSEITGSAAQLGINVLGMILAGTITMACQRAVVRRFHHRIPQPGRMEP